MKNNLLITTLLACLISISGCSGNTQSSVNISEWMLADDLTPYECQKVLGKSEEKEGNNYTLYFWNDYKICDNYNGVLSLLYSEKQDEYSSNSERRSYSFSWTSQCSENEYSKILNELKNYDHLQIYASCAPNGTDEMKKNYEKENGEQFNFITDFEDKNYNSKYFPDGYTTEYFTIHTTYKDNVLEVQWGTTRNPVTKEK